MHMPDQQLCYIYVHMVHTYYYTANNFPGFCIRLVPSNQCYLQLYLKEFTSRQVARSHVSTHLSVMLCLEWPTLNRVSFQNLVQISVHSLVQSPGFTLTLEATYFCGCHSIIRITIQ